VVLQENFLFDGTVADNIRFARPDATRAEIEEAAQLANADEFVRAFPDGLRHRGGRAGIKLSGGQRQRIAIARALLADPRILILDEATSSLDSESEYKIQEGLRRLRHGRTSFVIAHRLSTIRSADQILVLEEGTHRGAGHARGADARWAAATASCTTGSTRWSRPLREPRRGLHAGAPHRAPGAGAGPPAGAPGAERRRGPAAPPAP
jgi:ABC-type bacteriocin/lantibiotic exporter with double-glycine peptidase domain